MVRILSHNFDSHKILESVSQDTLSFIISTSGTFLSEIQELIQTLPGIKVIITAKETSDVLKDFNYWIHVGGGTIPIKKGIYYTHAIEYCLDVLINEYKLTPKIK